MANNRKETSTTDFFLSVVHKEENNKKDQTTNSEKKISKETNAFNRLFSSVYTFVNSVIDTIIKNRGPRLILSGILSIVLFVFISGGQIFSTTSSGTTLKDVPVLIEGLDDQYEISGVPDTIDIGVIGPSIDINSLTFTGNYEAYIDVSGYKEGTYTLDIQTRNFADSLDVMVVPQSVTVTLSPKVSQKFSLGYKFVNEDDMNSNYSAYIKEKAVKSVTVRASESTLQKISKVVACVDVSGVTSDFEQDAEIKAYNSKGKELDVEIAPSTVHVECGISTYMKSVPIHANFIGLLPDGYAISTYKLSTNTVKVYGEEENLNNLEYVEVDVDLSNVTENTTIKKLKVRCDQPYNKLSVNTVDIDVELDSISTVSFDNLTIQVENLTDGYSSKITDTASVTVTGSTSAIASTSSSDIEVYVDAKDLKKGTHSVEVQVKGTNDTLTYTLTSNQKVDVVIGG